LHFDESLSSRRRCIEILKSRGQDFISGKYPFKFNDQGLQVINVIDIQQISNKEQSIYSEKLSSGIDGLDNILNGGFFKGSTIMVEGTSGTGKTVMGIHYLIEGIKRGEKGLLLLTEESAYFVNQYANSFNKDDNIDRIFANEDVLIIDRIPNGTSVEEIISDVIGKVKLNSIQRVVIDFLNTFVEFSDNLLILKILFRKLLNNLSMLGCTTILIINEDQAGSMSPLKSIIQPLVQGEIRLSFTIRQGKRHRSLEVSKMKGQKYISGVHLAEISSNGMSVFQRLGGI
jgi:circadian clock protein KaiC